jgi:hypothetical protein
MNKFAMSLGGNKALMGHDISALLKSIMDLMIVQYDRTGWISFPIAKTVVALALGAGAEVLAADFARYR